MIEGHRRRGYIGDQQRIERTFSVMPERNHKLPNYSRIALSRIEWRQSTEGIIVVPVVFFNYRRGIANDDVQRMLNIVALRVICLRIS